MGHGLNDAPKFAMYKVYSGGDTNSTQNDWWYYYEEKYGDFIVLNTPNSKNSFTIIYVSATKTCLRPIIERMKFSKFHII